MGNAHILWQDKTELASFTGGSWVALLPLDNLKNDTLSQTARSTDLLPASTKFTATFSESNYVRAIALLNHNLSLSAKIKITATLSSVEQFNSGWIDVFQAIYNTEDLEFEDANWWSGKATEDSLQGYSRNYFNIFDANVTADSWTIEIDDQSNEAGYIDLGKMFLSQSWQLDRNFNYGADMGFTNRSTKKFALNGTPYFNTQRNPRSWKISISNLTKGSAYANIVDMFANHNISGYLLFIPVPDDNVNLHREVFVSTMGKAISVTHPGYQRYNTNLTFDEVLP
jgi:hypothetical protein